MFSSPPILIIGWNSNWEGVGIGVAIWGRLTVRSWEKAEHLSKVGTHFFFFNHMKTQPESATCEAENRHSAYTQSAGTLFLNLELWEIHVDIVYKLLNLWYFVPAVWAGKTDEKWNNQPIKPDISQTSGKLLLCRDLVYNLKRFFLDASSDCLPVLHSRARVCGPEQVLMVA